MDEMTLKVAIAGFMHDIGSLADASVFPLTKEFLHKYARFNADSRDSVSHPSPLYTAAVIDRMIGENLLPKALIQGPQGDGDDLIDLAAGHQRLQSPLQWIVALAVRLARGWDENKSDSENIPEISTAEFMNLRLQPIFEHLMQEVPASATEPQNHSWHYPLKEVSPQNIFPAKADLTRPRGAAGKSERTDIFKKFMSAAARLAHKKESLSLWFEHFESLVMASASLAPSAMHGGTITDVPVYDHLKLTSAFAVALYLYHKSTGTLNSESIASLKDYTQPKFLVIGGDFYGIQNFIFSDSGEAKKNRSKILRGRSFAVSLFSELAADMLCRAIGIPSVSVVLNCAGKFIIIAPNTDVAKKAADTVQNKVNDWFMKISYGEMAIGIDAIQASSKDFTSGHFMNLWEKLSRQMDNRKYSKIDLDRFGGTVETYLKSFNTELHRPLCPFCGKRPSSGDLEGCDLIGDARSTCPICRDHVFLGTKLVKKERLAITTKDAPLWGGDEAKLAEPIFGEYQVAFADGQMNEMARADQLLKYWDVAVDPDGVVFKDVSNRFINGSIPECTEESLKDKRLVLGKKSGKKKTELLDPKQIGAPKTFEHIAAMAFNMSEEEDVYRGIDALGVLKADVDNLGLIMSCGMEPNRFTPARLLALSRQVNWYFALYLPHLLKTTPEFNDIYTVFAGGDDLFLIGPWNRVVELAGVLHKTFAQYVCQNDKIRFSAGITLHKTHTPLDKLAHQAEVALGKSKDEGRNRITLFNETAEWDEFLLLQRIKDKLLEWRESKLINNALLYRLDEFISMAEESKLVLEQQEIHIEQMQCLKWRALFHYTAARNVGRDVKAETPKEKELRKAEMVNEFSCAVDWLATYGAKLKIALWDVIYNQRKGA